MTRNCREVGENEELLLDGALAPEDAAACLAHLETCSECRARWEAGAFLDRALPRALREAPAPRSTRPEFQRASRVPWATAAAALLALGWLAFDRTRLSRRVESEVLPQVSAQRTWEAPSDRQLVLASAGMGRLTLSAGSRLAVRAENRLELQSGTLSYVGGSEELHFSVPAAEAELRLQGQGSLVAAGLGGRPFTIVTPTSGSATLHRTSTPPDPLPIGDARVLSAAFDAGVGGALARLDQLASDEALVVMTADEAFDSTLRDQHARDQLEAEVGELLAENSRIRLENEALRRKLSEPDRLTLNDLFQSVGELAEIAHGPRRMELGTLVRAAARASEGREDEAVSAVRSTLWAPGSSSNRRRAGFMLLGALRSAAVKQALIDALPGAEVEIRPYALEALAGHDDPSLREIFATQFRESTDESVRVAAAGALVRLGEVGEPLTWLESVFDRPVLSGRVRMRILSRILAAPSERVGPILVNALTSPRLSVTSKCEIVGLLGRLGTKKAQEVLEFVAQVPVEVELLREIERALTRLRP